MGTGMGNRGGGGGDSQGGSRGWGRRSWEGISHGRASSRNCFDGREHTGNAQGMPIMGGGISISHECNTWEAPDQLGTPRNQPGDPLPKRDGSWEMAEHR